MLRKLTGEDAPYMLEWMHDPDMVGWMDTDFRSKTIGDCYAFIAQDDPENSIHMAIADEHGEYMGTVSLKNIDRAEKKAEFAIAVRKCASGKGYARDGMKEMLGLAGSRFGLKTVYWYVRKDNARALRFYDKNGYERVSGSILPELDDGTYIFYQAAL